MKAVLVHTPSTNEPGQGRQKLVAMLRAAGLDTGAGDQKDEGGPDGLATGAAPDQVLG